MYAGGRRWPRWCGRGAETHAGLETRVQTDALLAEPDVMQAAMWLRLGRRHTQL
jgi:hypothetical protein